jgi:hypothetical protein
MRMSLRWVCVAALAFAVAGCGSEQGGGHGNDQTGQLSLPLVAYGPSGVQYRLSADFHYYGWDYQGEEDTIQGSFSTSDYPDDAESITLDLPRGDYELYLEDGWQLEKIVDGVAEPVEATLLSSRYQYVYIYPHSTSWVEFQFGIGDKTLWLNGKFTVQVSVWEDPDEYYGQGQGGYGGGPWATGGSYIGTGGAAATATPVE